MNEASETKKRKWIVTMEVEVEVPDHHDDGKVRETMEWQMEQMNFGPNLFWAVTERRVTGVRQKGRFW